MKKIIFFVIVLLLSGCATQQGEGVPSNSFPRHKLNFLFNEGLVLDYSELDADNWRTVYQDVTGRYALTEFIPKKESESNWSQKFVVAFYPKLTMPKQATLDQIKVLIEQSTPWPCLKEASAQMLTQTPEEMLLSQQGKQCDVQGNEIYQVIRLVKTEQGVHQLAYLERSIHPDLLRVEQYIQYLTQAQVIKKKPKEKK